MTKKSPLLTYKEEASREKVERKTGYGLVSSRIPLVDILMITNQGY